MEKIDLKRTLKDINFKYEKLRPPIPQILDFTSGKILSPYRSDSVKALWSLRELNFAPLAWTPNVRYIFYNPAKYSVPAEDVLLEDVEGDLYFTFNPTEDFIAETLKAFPKAEIAAEKYDPRFNT